MPSATTRVSALVNTGGTLPNVTDPDAGAGRRAVDVVRAAGVEHCKSAEFSGDFSGGKEKGTPKGA